ncbi:MAG: radical SAM/SPASM domain-containing protein [Candidatus Bathyarchaeales archaeon]
MVSNFYKRLNSYLYILWNITYRCNLNCKHCMVADERKNKVQELDETSAIRLLTNVCLSDIEVKEFNFQGGEPLVATSFEPAIEWLGEHGVPWTVNTNGTLWSDRHFDLIKKYPPREIVVSLDGDSQTHDWLRGPEVFSKLQETIKIIHDISNGAIQIDAICVLHKKNVKNIVSVFETAACMGIRQLVLSKLFISGNAVLNRDLLEPDPIDLFNVLEIVARLKGRFEGTDLFVQWATPLMLVYFDLPIGYSGCPAIRSEVTITPTGELQPCPNALARLQRRFGKETGFVEEHVSLLNKDLESIRTSPLFLRIYELLHGPLSPPRHTRCLDCYYVEICQTCPSDRWIGRDEYAELCHYFQDLFMH